MITFTSTNNLISLYPNVEVFEVEIEDFIILCRENFSRLTNRQIKAHITTRVWLMYQGPNFNESYTNILPVKIINMVSNGTNLTGFDLAIGDRVLFYKTGGLDRIKLQKISI